MPGARLYQVQWAMVTGLDFQCNREILGEFSARKLFAWCFEQSSVVKKAINIQPLHLYSAFPFAKAFLGGTLVTSIPILKEINRMLPVL